ncbi:MAG: hypothetical protein AABW47_02485 [Nanoarchaeota archaeon]
MSALTIEQIIKIILGLIVVVAVVVGLYLVFKNNFFDFFKGISVGDPAKLFIGLIR